MAKNFSLLGPGIGSIGDITFSNWKGISVAKKRARQVANPNTPAQQSARSRIALLTRTFQQIPLFIQTAWRMKAVKKSEANAWTSAQNKTQYLVLEPTGLYSGITVGDLQLTNPAVSLPTVSMSIVGPNIVTTFDNLVPNRKYQVVLAVQKTETLFADTQKAIDVTADSNGDASLNVLASTFGAGLNQYAYIAVVDTVTTNVFGFKNSL